jgi:hypothetical protein
MQESLTSSLTTNSPKTSDLIVIECDYIEPHQHHYPADWRFGGVDGLDPRADIRYRPSTYVYFDRRLQPIHLTQVPLCDNQAIDEFTKVASWGSGFAPVWVQVSRPGEKPVTLPVMYDKATDEFEVTGG